MFSEQNPASFVIFVNAWKHYLDSIQIQIICADHLVDRRTFMFHDLVTVEVPDIRLK